MIRMATASGIRVARWAALAASIAISYAAAPGTESPPLPGLDTGKICVVDMGSNTFKLILGEIAGLFYRHRAGLFTPSFCIRLRRVLGFMFRIFAAPRSPSIIQLV